MQLSKDEIQHIAKLARLELSDEELEKYGNQLSNVLKYVEQLQEVDVDRIEPTAQVTGLFNVFRKDEIIDWDKSEIDAALKDSPESDERFVKTKRILG